MKHPSYHDLGLCEVVVDDVLAHWATSASKIELVARSPDLGKDDQFEQCLIEERAVPVALFDTPQFAGVEKRIFDISLGLRFEGKAALTG